MAAEPVRFENEPLLHLLNSPRLEELSIPEGPQELHEIIQGDAIYTPLGRLGELGLEGKGTIGKNNQPLNEIDTHWIESSISNYARTVCCIDGRTRIIANKVKQGAKRSYLFVKHAVGNPMKLAGGGAGVAYSGFLAGMSEGVNSKNYANKSRDEARHNIFKPLRLKKSVHADEHAHGNNCGCGACDKLQESNRDIALNFSRYDELYRDLSELFPKTLPPADEGDRSSVVYHSQTAHKRGLIPSGKEITKPYKKFKNPAEGEDAHEEAQVVVEGNHDEKAIVISLDSDGTVDKHKLPFQLLWIDLGSFSKEVQARFTEEDGMQSQRNAHRLIYATTLFQLVTANQLCHQDMPVYVRHKRVSPERSLGELALIPNGV